MKLKEKILGTIMITECIGGVAASLLGSAIDHRGITIVGSVGIVLCAYTLFTLWMSDQL